MNTLLSSSYIMLDFGSIQLTINELSSEEQPPNKLNSSLNTPTKFIFQLAVYYYSIKVYKYRILIEQQ